MTKMTRYNYDSEGVMTPESAEEYFTNEVLETLGITTSKFTEIEMKVYMSTLFSKILEKIERWDIGRKKILIEDGMSNDVIIFITDAPREEIEKWCYGYNQEILKGENTYFKSLEKNYYVKVLHDSLEDDYENIETIGYDESYNLQDYYLV